MNKTYFPIHQQLILQLIDDCTSGIVPFTLFQNFSQNMYLKIRLTGAFLVFSLRWVSWFTPVPSPPQFYFSRIISIKYVNAYFRMFSILGGRIKLILTVYFWLLYAILKMAFIPIHPTPFPQDFLINFIIQPQMFIFSFHF